MMLILFLVLLFVPVGVEAACSGSGTAFTCPSGATHGDVRTAISSASDGAVITFSTGSYSWGGSPYINPSLTKGVTLICENGGTCSVTTSGTVITLPLGTSSKLYRISGFTWTVNADRPIWECPGGGCSGSTGTLSNVRIDHNTITINGSDRTFWQIGESSSNSEIYIYGVVDHNTVTCGNSCYFLQASNFLDSNSPPTRTLGSVNNLFLEDNSFTVTTMTNNGTGCVDGWGGHSIVFRFNTVFNCRVLMHGVGGGHYWGPINFEVYGNFIEMDNADGVASDCGRCIHHQGSGMMMYWENVFKQSPGEPHAPNGNGYEPIEILHYRAGLSGSGSAICDGNDVSDGDGNRSPIGTYAGYPCNRQPGRDRDGTLFPIFGWKNRWDDDGAIATIGCSSASGANTCTKHVVNNRDYYNAISASAQSSSSSPFNGTTGMGFGTLANRPVTCTTNSESADAGNGGVGYWATDQGSWNTSSTNPEGVQQNGADGVLYICTATNTWSVYYTPYTYPHPLVGGEAPPSSPGRFSPGINLRRAENDLAYANER